MEPLWKLSCLLEPCTFSVIVTSVLVTFGSAFRALNYTKEAEKNRLMSRVIFTVKTSHALIFPLASSFCLIALFHLFSTLSHLLAVFTSISCALALHLCLFFHFYELKPELVFRHPYPFSFLANWPILLHYLLNGLSFGIVGVWLVSGNWILYNLIGIAYCFVVVTHFRLPNIRICAMLMAILFLYDVFWVFYSERFFGANVMESVATQRASNPLYTVANRLSLPGLQLIKKKVDLPGKLIFPHNLFGGAADDKDSRFMMIGLGDLMLPGMLLALVLCFDYRKSPDAVSLLDLASSKGHKYIWYAVSGYAIGLVAAVAAVILTHSSQPALFYLVPSTLGPVLVVSWMRGELKELWDWKASFPNPNGKTHA